MAEAVWVGSGLGSGLADRPGIAEAAALAGRAVGSAAMTGVLVAVAAGEATGGGDSATLGTR
jgi:hypothetical protein